MWIEFTDNYAISDEGYVKNITTDKILVVDINYNKLDNRSINLEWCDNQYNNQHGYLHGRISGRTKLSVNDILHILTTLEDKSISVKNLAKLYNVAVPTIYAVKQGLNMKRLKYLKG